MKKAIDPVRLVEDAATPEPLADALRLARSGPDPRSMERMSAALGVAAPVTPPAVPPASGLAAASGTSIPALGIVALVGAVGAGGAVFGLAAAPESSVPPAVRAVATSSARIEPSEPTSAPREEVLVPEAVRRSSAAPALRRRRAEPEPTAREASPTPAPAPLATAPADAASRLREEALLVRNAERLLGSEPGHALALTEERRRRFPGGALDQEAEVVAIDALLRLGRREAATSRARTFEARHPGSLHARRIRALFGSNP